MVILRIDDVLQAELVPDGWVEVTDNGWGYLLLMGLQESGLLSKITRIARPAVESGTCDIIDEAICAYVEDTAQIQYAPSFLQWQWYIQKPVGTLSFWPKFITEVYARTTSAAPEPEENYQAMLGAICTLYLVDATS